jgi:class 3 adenylate cyclase/tetratricopeptide (TPR) repeat protein
MVCPACSTENPEDAKFCNGCGVPLARVCASCGKSNAPGARFCSECGAALTPASSPSAPAAAERRLVSVLFADLVGFTPLSESRDAEEVRELLSSYFDLARTLIGRYGGTVEKFIGDAVMAVWGSPTATEDDAERAVRAALDLVAAVEELDPGLHARAGVLTGEAAVTLGSEAEGMVAGDMVNTASRIQSTAEPGTVLVGEATRRATERAIVYEDAASAPLKGKAEPVRLWRALRVVASRGGALRAEGLEPPFVGRDRELRLVKELFHVSSEEGKAHLVSVVGIAGIGKSRLAWEFEKYLDGLLEQIWWHRGRCLAYGEGVAYWALAEMVRMRARITEEELPGPALEKLRAVVAEHAADTEEREWLETRLAHLLGLGERTGANREDLFAAWRLFFERLADAGPVLLVFEDIQWADRSLLDFIEYLLDWSRSHPVFVLALARPEASARHGGLGAAGRNATTLSLEPLSPEAMEQLLDGFVPGLPAELRTQILARSEGVPLYAVETVRMLLDRGLLERTGDVYRPTGPIGPLDVPETLHALVAARLDGLAPQERRLVQDAAVLGRSFTKAGLAAVSGSTDDEVAPVVASLVRKEILSVQADPRSPEHGQYNFLQDLLKRVAYETLTRKDRKARHLAAAAHLEQAWGSPDQEVVEVVAAHYLDAYAAAPDAEDAAEIRSKAFDQLVRAADRAASLAAGEEAQHYYEQAAGLAPDPTTQASLLEQAGVMALQGGRAEPAVERLERAIELFQGEGQTHPAARVAARLGRAYWLGGKLAEGTERIEEAFRVLADDEPDADLAAVAAELGRLRFFLGEIEAAAERVDRALEIAESLGVPEVLSEALNTKHLVLDAAGRHEEALGLLQRAYAIALEHDLGASQRRALINLAYQFAARDEYQRMERLDLEGLELSRRRGDRDSETLFIQHLLSRAFMVGDWSEVMRLGDEIDEVVPEAARPFVRLAALPMLFVARGEISEARRVLDDGQALAGSGEVQSRVLHLLDEAIVLRGEGRAAEALATAERALAEREGMNARHPFLKLVLVEAAEAAFDLDDLDRVAELLAEWERMRPTERTPFLQGHEARFRARLAKRRGPTDCVDADFLRAAGVFREVGMPFYLGVVLAEHGEWLVEQGRAGEAEAVLAEAREIFERLEARPWLERLDAGQRARTRVPA